jgi:hypothetical protein
MNSWLSPAVVFLIYPFISQRLEFQVSLFAETAENSTLNKGTQN